MKKKKKKKALFGGRRHVPSRGSSPRKGYLTEERLLVQSDINSHELFDVSTAWNLPGAPGSWTMSIGLPRVVEEWQRPRA